MTKDTRLLAFARLCEAGRCRSVMAAAGDRTDRMKRLLAVAKSFCGAERRRDVFEPMIADWV